jgi:hypothetical protein
VKWIVISMHIEKHEALCTWDIYLEIYSVVINYNECDRETLTNERKNTSKCVSKVTMAHFLSEELVMGFFSSQRSDKL